jgi:hypothetical protein
VPPHPVWQVSRMTNDDARGTWQTPGLEPVTDASATADQTAPIRNGGTFQATT